MQEIQPVARWALNYIAALDQAFAGCAGSYLRASAERRQVIAAFLSVTPLPNAPDEAADLASFISRADHSSILKRAFGSVPTGMRGALARSGHEPFSDTGFYQRLHRTLTRNDPVAQVIRRLNRLDPNRLRIATLLPDHFVTPSLVSIIGSPSMARDVATMITLIEGKGIDREAFRKALASLTAVEQFPSFWLRWAGKCAFPAHPVPASERYAPVTDGRALRSLAKRYRNCARTYLEKALRGDTAFAEFKHPLGYAVVHLMRKGEDWVLDGLFGPSNRTAPPEVRDAAVRHLRTHGVFDKFGKRGGLDWSALRRLTAMSIFNIGME